MPEKRRFPSELFRTDKTGEEPTRRIVNHLEMPLKTVANIEGLVADITAIAAFRFVASVLVGEYLFAAGDVVGGG